MAKQRLKQSMRMVTSAVSEVRPALKGVFRRKWARTAIESQNQPCFLERPLFFERMATMPTAKTREKVQ